MSSMLFNIAIDWVLCRTVEHQRRGLRWTPFIILEDLDFADDTALLSHTRQHIQEKTDWLSMFSNQVGLRISLKNTEAMCVNVPSPTKIREEDRTSFHTANLRKILRIFWPQKISNDQLLRQTKQEDIRTLVNKRRWRWIGHEMRKASNIIARIAMHWTPEGKRSRGRPKTTWRRTVEKRLRGLNYSWSTIEKLAKDRQGWKDFVAALCATQT